MIGGFKAKIEGSKAGIEAFEAEIGGSEVRIRGFEAPNSFPNTPIGQFYWEKNRN